MPNFDRFANVTIGKRGQPGIRFGGLRVVFTIAKTLESTPNTGQISIYNASASSRNQIRTIGDAVELEAGYLQDEYQGRLAITADIMDIVTEKQGPDFVTTVKLGDGVEFLKTIKDSYSFKEGTTVKSIIQSITGKEGITVKGLGSVVDKAFANGFSEMGPLGPMLDKLVGKLGAQWSFQNNELQIIPKLGSNDSPVFELSAKTGMIGTPTRDVETSTITPAPQSDGWIVRALLRPEIGPGDRIKVVSTIEEANGIFHVKEITHAGDTEAGEWSSTMRVRESVNG